MDLKNISNMELLELYSKYNRIPLRTNDEQEILAKLRGEILRRMEK